MHRPRPLRLARAGLAAGIALAASPASAAPAPGAASPPVAAPSPAALRALVVHVPPGTARSGAPIELAMVVDAPLAETLVVHWRRVGEVAWQDAQPERSSAGGWYAELPGSPPPGVEYYIAGRAADGAELAHFASADAPHVVRVEPTLDDRLAALETARLHGRHDRVAIDVDGHDFGNRYGLLDRFIRAEASLTHHLGGRLDEIVFGFGAIQGSTPVDSMPDGGNARHGARYGFSGLRFRVAPGVFVDGRLSLGVSHAGFAPGIASAVTFGRPWQSCVSVGGEYLADLGPSLYVRLQWDTAAPLLMAASVVRTDLPGAIIDENGLYLKYEVMYELAARTTLRGSLSFGSRDGPARFGGGLGAAVTF